MILSDRYKSSKFKEISQQHKEEKVYGNEMRVLPPRQGVKEIMNLP